MNQIDITSTNSISLKRNIYSDNLKSDTERKINKFENVNCEKISNINNNNSNRQKNLVHKNSNSPGKELNVDDNDLKDKIPTLRNVNSVKFKENNEHIIKNEAYTNLGDDNIKNILEKADIKLENFSRKNIISIKNEIASTPETEKEYNILEVNNQAETINIKNFDSPNMIKNNIKINSNYKNTPNVFEINSEKNISNTTFRAGSEVNKNK